MVAPALRASAVGNREHGIDFVLLEVCHGQYGGTARRNGLDGRRVLDEFWSLPRDEPEQRVQRRETQIARGGRVAAFVFEVSEEATDDGRVGLLDRDPDGVGAMMLGDVTEQQADGVAVALLCVGAEVAVRAHLLDKEAAHEVSHQVSALRHRRSPVYRRMRNARSVSTPRRGVRGSWADTPGCRRG